MALLGPSAVPISASHHTIQRSCQVNVDPTPLSAASTLLRVLFPCAGGASFSLHSLQAAAIGAAAAIPLVLYKMGSWLPETQATDADLSALRKMQTDNAKPWLSGLDSTQLMAHLVMDTLPPLFLMLPAAQAGLTSSFAFTRAALGNSTGIDLPEEVGFLLALVMTGVVTAAVRSSDFMTDPAQVQVVSDAVANADR